MDIFTKGASWDYWKIGSDEIEVSDDESSDFEKYRSDKEEETAEIFKIETDIFYYETPLCLAFNEFKYLLKVDPDLLIKDTMGFKTYEDYKDDWIYEWNENVPWVYDKPWLDNRIWKELKPVKYTCKPFNYKTRCSEWPTCSWREDGYCNGGNFLGAYRIGNSLRYQDLEWYEALEDSELKDKALRNKAIMEGLIREYENETHEQGHELCSIKTREVPVCQIKRYKMIKYLFNDEEEYVAVKEDEYDDLTITSEEACRAYQEIFRMMDEGWVNGVVKRWNRTLVEAAQTMLSASKLPLFFWVEAITTAFRDGKNLDKMKEKGDPCIFVGYSTTSKGYRVYNKRTRLIVESIHINFDKIKEMTYVDNNPSGLTPQLQMTSEHNCSELETNDHNNEPSSSKLVPNVSPLADIIDSLQ
ncbi:VIER F-box protein 2 [Tanacetum coccineum]